MYFTPSMDALLLKAVEKFTINRKTSWRYVAAHVGGGMTNDQCGERYIKYLDPALHLLNNEPWTEAESERLKGLVQQEQQKSSTGDKIDWVTIGSKLKRGPDKCRQKWEGVQHSLRGRPLKMGAYSPEEDEIIMERVAAWRGMNKKGLWLGLETELGRQAAYIGQRWKNTLSKR
ncbi:hypothetical protein B484DRAFT_290697 [Ochromonadaceae sp. CCMP2298]|nr:hypothetical protein B484DRAFT_290697 [Ochromonadaceae sp. CCMP2298]